MKRLRDLTLFEEQQMLGPLLWWYFAAQRWQDKKTGRFNPTDRFDLEEID